MEVSNEGMDFIEAEKIAAVMRMAKPNVTVIGVGGAGSNIVSWIKERGIAGGKLIAANTDAAHLSITKADRRILIGEKLTHGQGAGGYPQRGAAATREALEDFQKETQNSNIIFLCAGRGGSALQGAEEAGPPSDRRRDSAVLRREVQVRQREERTEGSPPVL